MRTEASGLKWLLMVTIVGGALLASRDAAAQECTNDDDCPDLACGGQVCDWNMGRTCQPAGRGMKGVDGWCTGPTHDDCKCKALGATCNVVYCTFTRPCDAPGAAGCSSATGGSSGTATGGSSGTATGGSSGTATGGSSGTATGGSSGTATGGSSGTGTGGSSPPKDSGGGGCAIGGAASSSLLGTMIALGALVAQGRRRKRA